MSLKTILKDYIGMPILGLGLILGLAGCVSGIEPAQLKGRVISEERGETWYQVAIGNKNKNPLDADSIDRGSIDRLRFYGNLFNLDELDKKINPGTEIAVSATRVYGTTDYTFKVDGIDEIK